MTTSERPAPADSARPLRVAMVGAGMISRFHLHAWRNTPGVDLVAIVDPDPARRDQRAREFAVDRQCSTLDELLATVVVDAVDIATPRETHRPLIDQAAAAGLAILCQKPLVPTLDDAETLVARLDRDVRLMVNQNFRFRPHYQRIRRWIDEGRLGEIRGATISCRSSGLLRGADGRYPAIERQPFIRTEARMLIEEVLIHRIDAARWLCGPLELIGAATACTCPELVGESEATMLFRNPIGGSAVVVDGNLASAGYPPLSQDRVELIGTRARVMLDHHVLRLFGPEELTIANDYPVAFQQGFDGVARHFVECLRTGARFLTDPRDNLETLRLVEAAYRAADRHPAAGRPATPA